MSTACRLDPWFSGGCPCDCHVDAASAAKPDMGADRLPFPAYIGADVRLPVSDVEGGQ